jgi:hypothetical protein
MDLIEKHRITLLNAKCQVVCMAENLMKKMQHGDNIECCVKKLFTATRLINRLDCYCFPVSAQNINGSEYFEVSLIEIVLPGEYLLLDGSGNTLSSTTIEITTLLNEVIDNLLNLQSLSKYTIEYTDTSAIFTIETNCEHNNLQVFGNPPGGETLQLFSTITQEAICTSATTCNNCITDAQLNKMYQVLDSLLQ